jgi:hypothetical protein
MVVRWREVGVMAIQLNICLKILKTIKVLNSYLDQLSNLTWLLNAEVLPKITRVSLSHDFELQGLQLNDITDNGIKLIQDDKSLLHT